MRQHQVQLTQWQIVDWRGHLRAYILNLVNEAGDDGIAFQELLTRLLHSYGRGDDTVNLSGLPRDSLKRWIWSEVNLGTVVNVQGTLYPSGPEWVADAQDAAAGTEPEHEGGEEDH